MKKKRRFGRRVFCVLIVLFMGVIWQSDLLSQEPAEVRSLRKQEILQTDDNYREYYFGLLTEDEKKIYREMLSGIQERQDEFYLTSSNEQLISKVYHALLKDHPELFWVHNREEVYTTAYKGTDYCRFSPGYTYTDQEIQEIMAFMEHALEEVKEQITQDMSAYDKVKTVYTYLIDHAEYEASGDDQNIAGIFWKKKAVCAGYARAVQYLLEQLGVPCIYVEGNARNGDEGHAWNIVFLDGDWYYIDPTWGDASYQREEGEETPTLTETVNYDYFCVTTQEIERTHSMDDNQLLPVCNAVQDQYYRHEGLYLQSADKEKIDEIFARAAQKGAPMVCFQCADDTVYQEVYRLLIEEQGIFAYLPESETTAAYLDSDRERTFYFWFTEVS